MPTQVSYPGVYIEEVPSGVRTITGVATSIGAFVDFFKRGPMNKAVQILNPGDFEREFGGLDIRSEASYAIQQFFANGGTEAWVVRTASGTVQAAGVEIKSAIDGVTAIKVEAINPGVWGNGLRVSIDYPTSSSDSRFNMTVSLFETSSSGRLPVRTETFRGLSMLTTDANFVKKVVNDGFSGSKLIQVTGTPETDRPLQTGTLSGSLSATLSITAALPQVAVTIGTEGTATATLTSNPTSPSEARSLLEEAIRAAKPASSAFAGASVSMVGDRLRILAGPTESSARVSFASGGTDPTGAQLGLIAATPFEGLLSGDVAAAFPVPGGHPGGTLRVTIGAVGPTTVTLDAMADLAAAAVELQTKIRAADASPGFTKARVLAHTDGADERLIVLAGEMGSSVGFSAEAADTTVSDLGLDSASAKVISAAVSAHLTSIPTVATGSKVSVTIGAEGPRTATTTTNANSLSDIASQLQTAIRAAASAATFTGARVAAYSSSSENRLVVLAGNSGNAVVFSAAPADASTVVALKLDATAAQANVQSYSLGAGASITGTAQGAGQRGEEGDPPNALALIGNLNSKTGIHALEDVDIFNILCIPRTAMVSGDNKLTATEAASVISVANTYCEKRRAFFVMDTPSDVNEVQEIKEWLDANATLRHKNAALYFPRVQIADPLDGFKLRSVGASGTVAGLYARTDATRGVWKAPAGTEATLRGVQQFDYKLADPENGTLNPLGINCLRNFPIYGNVCWGARTLDGSDQQGSEWKYVPVRRIALFLEESLYRGTQWVVFEPNDEPLWAQIRLNLGAFMQNLFRQGAFQGKSPREAYFVKCDRETTTQNDINLGIVNIVVGFAPLKPAEFVIIKLQQIAGQIAT